MEVFDIPERVVNMGKKTMELQCLDLIVGDKDKLQKLINEQGDVVLLKLVITLRDLYVAFCSHRNSYDHSYCDKPFIDFTKKLISKSAADDLTVYVEQCVLIFNVNKHFTDLDQFIKKFGREHQVARKAVEALFGDNFNNISLRQLQGLYSVHILCTNLLVFLMWTRFEDPSAPKTEDKWKAPKIWKDEAPSHPFEEFLKANWGEKLPEMLGVKLEDIKWWDKPFSGRGVKVPVACRFMFWKGNIRTEGAGFYRGMSELRRSQWDVLEAAHPPPMNQKFLQQSNLHTLPNYPVERARECHDHQCPSWPEISLGPWFLMWQQAYGLPLMGVILHHHRKATAAVSAPPVKIRTPTGVRTRPASKVQIREILAKSLNKITKVLHFSQQRSDAPMPCHLVDSLDTFLLDVNVVMQLPWSPVLLQQWLCAALTTILEFEGGMLEFRHWGVNAASAGVVGGILSLVASTKERVLLGLLLLSRQALDFPSTDNQQKFPATIMDQVVLPSLAVLEWLCSGQAAQNVYALKLLNFTQEAMSVPAAAYSVNQGLQDRYMNHYWHILFWLGGGLAVTLPMSDSPLEEWQVGEVRDVTATPLHTKPLAPDEALAWEKLVQEHLSDLTADDKASHVLDCTRRAVRLLVARDWLTEAAERSLNNMLSGKKARRAASGLEYQPQMDSLSHAMVFSTLYWALDSALAELDKTESPLGRVVLLSGEVMQREQLVRLSATCAQLSGFSPWAKAKNPPVYSSQEFKPAWRDPATPQNFGRVIIGKMTSDVMLLKLQVVVEELQKDVRSWDRPWLWSLMEGDSDSTKKDTPISNEPGEAGIQLLDRLRTLLLNICRDSFDVWEAGGELFGGRLTCQYWLPSFFNMLRNVSCRGKIIERKKDSQDEESVPDGGEDIEEESEDNDDTVELGDEIEDEEDTQSDETQSDETQPDETQPDETQSDETQPDETQPDETQPDETQSDETQPDETQSDETQPDETQSDETQPDETQPDETQLDETQPDETQTDEKLYYLENGCLCHEELEEINDADEYTDVESGLEEGEIPCEEAYYLLMQQGQVNLCETLKYPLASSKTYNEVEIPMDLYSNIAENQNNIECDETVKLEALTKNINYLLEKDNDFKCETEDKPTVIISETVELKRNYNLNQEQSVVTFSDVAEFGEVVNKVTQTQERKLVAISEDIELKKDSDSTVNVENNISQPEGNIFNMNQEETAVTLSSATNLGENGDLNFNGDETAVNKKFGITELGAYSDTTLNQEKSTVIFSTELGENRKFNMNEEEISVNNILQSKENKLLAISEDTELEEDSDSTLNVKDNIAHPEENILNLNGKEEIEPAELGDSDYRDAAETAVIISEYYVLEVQQTDSDVIQQEKPSETQSVVAAIEKDDPSTVNVEETSISKMAAETENDDCNVNNEEMAKTTELQENSNMNAEIDVNKKCEVAELEESNGSNTDLKEKKLEDDDFNVNEEKNPVTKFELGGDLNLNVNEDKTGVNKNPDHLAVLAEGDSTENAENNDREEKLMSVVLGEISSEPGPVIISEKLGKDSDCFVSGDENIILAEITDSYEKKTVIMCEVVQENSDKNEEKTAVVAELEKDSYMTVSKFVELGEDSGCTVNEEETSLNKCDNDMLDTDKDSDLKWEDIGEKKHKLEAEIEKHVESIGAELGEKDSILKCNVIKENPSNITNEICKEKQCKEFGENHPNLNSFTFGVNQPIKNNNEKENSIDITCDKVPKIKLNSVVIESEKYIGIEEDCSNETVGKPDMKNCDRDYQSKCETPQTSSTEGKRARRKRSKAKRKRSYNGELCEDLEKEETLKCEVAEEQKQSLQSDGRDKHTPKKCNKIKRGNAHNCSPSRNDIALHDEHEHCESECDDHLAVDSYSECNSSSAQTCRSRRCRRKHSKKETMCSHKFSACGHKSSVNDEEINDAEVENVRQRMKVKRNKDINLFLDGIRKVKINRPPYAMRGKRIKNFVNLGVALLDSFEEDYLQWKKSPPPRAKPAKPVHEMGDIEKQKEVCLVKTSGLQAEHHLSQFLDLMNAYVRWRNPSQCEPVPGFYGFHCNIMSYLDEKEECEMNLVPCPEMRILFSRLGPDIILPFAKKLYVTAMTVFQVSVPGTTLSCPELSDMYFVGNALSHFELILSTQLLHRLLPNSDKLPVDMTTYRKFLNILRSELLCAVVLAEGRLEPPLSESVLNFAMLCRPYLTVVWRAVRSMCKYIGKFDVQAQELLGCENSSMKASVTNFMKGNITQLSAVFKLETHGTESKMLQAEKSAKAKGVKWCRNCFKLETKKDLKGSKKSKGPKGIKEDHDSKEEDPFLTCEVCSNPNDPHFFCSETCKESCKSELVVDHLEHTLSQLKA